MTYAEQAMRHWDDHYSLIETLLSQQGSGELSITVSDLHKTAEYLVTSVLISLGGERNEDPLSEFLSFLKGDAQSVLFTPEDYELVQTISTTGFDVNTTIGLILDFRYRCADCISQNYDAQYI